MSGEWKKYLPFKCRYEIAQVLLRDNPDQRKEIVEWMITE